MNSFTAPLRLLPLALAAGLVCTAAVAAKPRTVEVINIGAANASDLSSDGTTVVGWMNGNYAIFRWTAETGLVDLGRNPYIRTGGSVSGSPAVSADGKVVAANILGSEWNYTTSGRWTAEGGWEQLNHPLPADGGILDKQDVSVSGMSRDGSTVTGLYWRPYKPGGSAHGSVWTAATGTIGLETAGGSARIDDANGDGSVLAGWEENASFGGRQAAVWDKATGKRTFLDLNVEGYSTEAERLNTAGDMVVGQGYNPDTARLEATLWKHVGHTWAPTHLGTLPGTISGYSYANALSDDGTVVGGMNRAKWNVFEMNAFIKFEGKAMQKLGVWLASQGVSMQNKWHFDDVMGISADGMTILAVAHEINAPYAQRSFLIKRQTK